MWPFHWKLGFYLRISDLTVLLYIELFVIFSYFCNYCKTRLLIQNPFFCDGKNINSKWQVCTYSKKNCNDECSKSNRKSNTQISYSTTLLYINARSCGFICGWLKHWQAWMKYYMLRWMELHVWFYSSKLTRVTNWGYKLRWRFEGSWGRIQTKRLQMATWMCLLTIVTIDVVCWCRR